MENAQRELLGVLLGTVYAQGLLSKAVYLRAVDLVHSGMDLPPFFRCPAWLAEETG